jgi:hypothetical protein
VGQALRALNASKIIPIIPDYPRLSDNPLIPPWIAIIIDVNPICTLGGITVSIVRIGLAETKGFSDGYDAIFSGKKQASATVASVGKKKAAKKKPVARKAKKK